MLNHIVIMGRLTRDPELRRTGSGIAVASFTLAVDRDFAPKDGGERRSVEVIAESVYFGDSKRDSGMQRAAAGAIPQDAYADIPALSPEELDALADDSQLPF